MHHRGKTLVLLRLLPFSKNFGVVCHSVFIGFKALNQWVILARQVHDPNNALLELIEMVRDFSLVRSRLVRPERREHFPIGYWSLLQLSLYEC